MIGNLGVPILKSLIEGCSKKPGALPFTGYNVCVRSDSSEQNLKQKFSSSPVEISYYRNANVQAVSESDVVILGVDPADVAAVLQESGLREAFHGKLLISVAAGWTRQKLEVTLNGDETTAANSGDGRAWVVRTLPNIAAQVGQSLTGLEISEPAVPSRMLEIAQSIFDQAGKTVRIPPQLMDPLTALGGSTPAFFAVICDALIDAAVAVGMPRAVARTVTSQAMLGTATMLAQGLNPADLKDQGTSPEGCTIAGLMVMEENAVRGHMGRALREAVTVARLMGKVEHVNDTRH